MINLDEFDTFIAIIVIIATICGLTLCFYGWGVYQDILEIVGGLMGLILGIIVVASLDIDGIIALAIVFAAAAIGSKLLCLFHEIATFSGGAVAGILIYKLVFVSTSYSHMNIFKLLTSIFSISGEDVLFAIIGGVIALMLHKLYVILFTAILGSGILSIIFGEELFIPLILIGSAIQYGLLSLLKGNVEDEVAFCDSSILRTIKEKTPIGKDESKSWKEELFDMDE